MEQGVLQHVRDHALGQSDVGEDVGQVLGDVQLHGAQPAEGQQRLTDQLLQPGALQRRRHRSRLQPGGVEQVADEALQPVGAGLDGGQQLGGLLRRPRDVVLPQAGDRRLCAGVGLISTRRHSPLWCAPPRQSPTPRDDHAVT